MKLYDLPYSHNLERRVALDLDRIIFISDTLDDDCVLVISVETKSKNITDRFEFPSKEYRDSAHFNILCASCASVILPTRE